MPNSPNRPTPYPPALPGASAVPAFAARKKFHAVPDFPIGPGRVTFESLGLPPVQIGYLEVGTPHRDAAGAVDNAILILPYYSGCATNMLDFWMEGGGRTDFSGGAWLGPGKLFDTDKFYVVVVDALGLAGASRPASSHPGQPGSVALGPDFPAYRVEDCAELAYRLLTDKLGVKRCRLVTGVSFGATLTYAMAALHPEFCRAILPIGGTVHQDRGMVRWLFDLMTQALKSDPVWRATAGRYHHLPPAEQPYLGNLFGWSILRQSAFVDEYRVSRPFEEMEQEMFDWEKSAQMAKADGKIPGVGQKLHELAKTLDANDLIARNECQGRFDLTDRLDRITARTLILHVETDQWIRLHVAKLAAERIRGAQLKTFPHDFGHYAVFQAPGRYQAEIRELLEG